MPALTFEGRIVYSDRIFPPVTKIGNYRVESGFDYAQTTYSTIIRQADNGSLNSWVKNYCNIE
jgi:hypothetical protein